MLTIWLIGFVISLVIDVVCYICVEKFNVDIENYRNYYGDFKNPGVIISTNVFFAVIWPLMLVLTVMKLLEVK